MISLDKIKQASLNKTQSIYMQVMNGQSGVLYITAQPGVAKSATMRAIANKLDLQYKLLIINAIIFFFNQPE